MGNDLEEWLGDLNRELMIGEATAEEAVAAIRAKVDEVFGENRFLNKDLTFEVAWAEKEKQGYQYGNEALAQVQFGWNLAMESLRGKLESMPNKYRPRTLAERLGYLAEECGEVLAAVGKTLRWGPHSVNPELPPEEQETNQDWILRELRDLERAIWFARRGLGVE